MKQTNLFKMLVLTLVCFFSLAEANESHQCIDIYLPAAQNNQVFGFLKFGKKVPQDPRRTDFEKETDNVDVFLMLKSFGKRIGVQPVEMGIVEILDQHGAVLWTSDLAIGEIARVDMRYVMSAAFREIPYQPLAKTIRFRHTHPPGLKGHGVSYNSWKFSQADISANRSYREAMDKRDDLRQLDLEVTIVYIDPNIGTFSTGTDTFRKICKTKAYRLKSL